MRQVAKAEHTGPILVLAIENPIVRSGLQNSLSQAGYDRRIEITNLERLEQTLNDITVDVIVTATELGGEPVPPLISRLRRGELRHHPIPVVIELLTSSESDYVREVIDSGPDDLLQLPISPAQLMTRLAVLTERRKPFVVTSNYVGPDRRQSARTGSMVIPLLDVPNPLAARAEGKSDDAFDTELNRCRMRLTEMRAERYSFELHWLSVAIKHGFDTGSRDAERLDGFCERIKTLLCGLPDLMPKGLTASAAHLAKRLETGVGILQKSGLESDPSVQQGMHALIASLVKEVRDALSPAVVKSADLAAMANSQMMQASAGAAAQEGP